MVGTCTFTVDRGASEPVRLVRRPSRRTPRSIRPFDWKTLSTLCANASSLLRHVLRRVIVAAVDLRRSVLLPLTVTAVLAGQLPASAHQSSGEHLDRGLVAATAGDGVHLSWRLFGREATGATATGL